jgi:hypothetical protein
MTAGILIIFAGYTIASYGAVLLKGYDIPFSRWINPLNPWQWPSGAVPVVPAGQILPS